MHETGEQMRPLRKSSQSSQASFRRDRLALAVLAALCWPAAAHAEDDAVAELTTAHATVEVGGAYVDEDSRKFGEYTGLTDKGGYLIGNVDVAKRNPLDASYWILKGTNLGLDSRDIQGKGGVQGSFKVWGEYNEIPKYGPTIQTIFEGVGSNNLTLPAGFQGITSADTANNATGLARRQDKINPYLHDVNLETKRKDYLVGFEKNIARGWTGKVSYRQEDKDGTKLFGGVIGNTGGNPRAALLPEAIDYRTRDIDATVSYFNRKVQFQAGYYFSKFENNNAVLNWQNPFAAINGWASAAGFPTGTGTAALYPDNEFHRVSASGGYNFSESTRASFSVELGRMTQDDPFLPYTSNPLLTVSTPLPRSSADARIDVTNFTASLSSHPLPKLALHAQYRYEDQDNKTPQAEYVYIGGDSTNQTTAEDTDRTRINLPVSSTKHTFKVAGDYEIMRRTKAKLGYDYEQVKRTFSDVEKNTTNRVEVGLRRMMTEDVTGSITYWRSKRTGSDYCYACTFVAGYGPGFVEAEAEENIAWSNLPLFRRFVYQDRDQDKVRFALNAAPSEMVTLQLFADYVNNDYNAPVHGLQFYKTESYTAEVSFVPTDRVTGYAYYTRDRTRYETQGLQYTGTTKPTVGFVTESPFDWTNTGKDTGDTFGVGLKFAAIPDRVNVGVDFMYSKSVGKIDTVTGASINPPGQPLPDLVTKLRSVQLYGTYKVNKDVTLKAMYWYQKLEASDWAWDTIQPASIPNVITTGQVAPDYNVNFVGISVIYRFW